MSTNYFVQEVAQSNGAVFGNTATNDVLFYSKSNASIFLGTSNATSYVQISSTSSGVTASNFTACNIYSSNITASNVTVSKGTFSNGTFSNGNFQGTFSGNGALLTSIPTTGIAGTVSGVLQVSQGGTGSTATATGTGAVVLNNAPTFVGIVTGGTFSGTHSGNGASLTNIPTTGIAGTVSGVLQVSQGGTGNGAITGTTGTGNIVLSGGTPTFTSGITLPNGQSIDASGNVNGLGFYAGVNGFHTSSLTVISAAGAFTGTSMFLNPLLRNVAITFTGNNGTSTAFNFTVNTTATLYLLTLNTNNGEGSFNVIGFITVNQQNGFGACSFTALKSSVYYVVQSAGLGSTYLTVTVQNNYSNAGGYLQGYLSITPMA